MEICMDEILSVLNANWSIWPLVSIVIIGIVEYCHHKDISSMIDRISIVKWGEKQLEMNSKTVQQSANEMPNLNNDNIEELKKHLEFERLYNMAFQSQLQMLINIKNMNNMPMPYVNANNFFLLHRSMLPITSQPMANEIAYFQWLLDMNLVERKSDNSFILTEKGIEFIGYIFLRNYNINLKML